MHITTMHIGFVRPIIAFLRTDDTTEVIRSYQYEDYRDKMC